MENAMADNPATRGEPDRSRINVNQEHEVRYWSQKLGISADELKQIVGEVGPMADAVEQRARGRSHRGNT
jgi:hypothetical protein